MLGRHIAAMGHFAAMGTDGLSRARRPLALAALLAIALGFSGAGLAQEVDQAALDDGLKVYKTTGVCQDCHGWNGDGGLPGDEGPAGPSLVITDLDREGIMEVVRCGRPSSGMPRHSKSAWSANETCYGMVTEDVGDQMPPPPEGRWLRPSQIENVATYIIAVYKGKEMTLENCERFFHKGSRSCNDYR